MPNFRAFLSNSQVKEGNVRSKTMEIDVEAHSKQEAREIVMRKLGERGSMGSLPNKQIIAIRRLED